jgi:hypothetical protein
MWHGWAQSRCRCGGGEAGPGADVAGASPVPAQMWHGCAESWHRCESGEETHLLVGLVFFVGAAAFLLQSATKGNDEHRDTLQHSVLQHVATRCNIATGSAQSAALVAMARAKASKSR